MGRYFLHAAVLVTISISWDTRRTFLAAPGGMTMPKRIFISYSKADSEPTQELADFLSAEGYTVWWDTDLTSGEDFRRTIDRELDAADAIVVIWTARSIASNWVIAEADHGARRNRLITVRTRDLEPWRIPKPYNTLHTDIVDDRRAIAAAVQRLVGVPLEPATRRSDSFSRYKTEDNAPKKTITNLVFKVPGGVYFISFVIWLCLCYVITGSNGGAWALAIVTTIIIAVFLSIAERRGW
jgi:hypothetical protein